MPESYNTVIQGHNTHFRIFREDEGKWRQFIASLLFLLHSYFMLSIHKKNRILGLNPRFFIQGLTVALLAVTGCTVSEINLRPQDVFSRPEVSYKNFKDIVVYVDLGNLPQDQREPKIISAVEKGLIERGFNILGYDGFVDFALKKRIAPRDAMNPRSLALIKQELGKPAVLRVMADAFMAQGRIVDPLKIVTPGVPGQRGTGEMPMDSALRDRREWVIDLSLVFEMLDTSTAEKLWSCSFARFQCKYEGKLEDFIFKAVGVCLDTIPAR
jgi:hypothetical protein